MKLSSIKTDLNAADSGIWFNLDETAKVKIAKWGNKAHAAYIRELGKKHGRKNNQGLVSDEQATKLLAGQWEFIITDFEGFEDDDGNPIKYSSQLIIDLALNEEYKDFFSQIESISRDAENYRKENIESLGE